MLGLALEDIGQDLRKVCQKTPQQYSTWACFWYSLTWHCFNQLLIFLMHNVCKNISELYVQVVLLFV